MIFLFVLLGLSFLGMIIPMIGTMIWEWNAPKRAAEWERRHAAMMEAAQAEAMRRLAGIDEATTKEES